MQVLTVLLSTLAVLSILCCDVKALPVSQSGDVESSTAKQDKEYKRICGMSYYGCKNGVKIKHTFSVMFLC